MNKRPTTVIVMLAGIAAALVAGPNGPLGGFWRPIPVDPDPVGLQRVGLIGSGAVEAIGFAAALAVLIVGRTLFTRLTASSRRATVAQVAAAWLLGSWWPHTALHMHFGPDPAVLALLEVVFHAGSITAFALLLWSVIPPVARSQRLSVRTDRARPAA